MENPFSKKMSSKSEDELKRIISNRGSFSDQAVLAAIHELEKNDQSNSEFEEIKSDLLSKVIAKEQTRKAKKNDDFIVSKVFVLLTSVVLFPLIGGLLLSINLFSQKKRKRAVIVISFSLFYTLITLLVFGIFENHFGVVLLANSLGAALLSEFFWNRYLVK